MLSKKYKELHALEIENNRQESQKMQILQQ